MDPTTIKIVKDYYQILVTIINELHSTQMWYQRQPTTDSEPEITSMRLQGLLCLTRIPWKIHAVFAAAFVTSFLAALAAAALVLECLQSQRHKSMKRRICHRFCPTFLRMKQNDT
jgi:hypothetical protein